MYEEDSDSLYLRAMSLGIPHPREGPFKHTGPRSCLCLSECNLGLNRYKRTIINEVLNKKPIIQPKIKLFKVLILVFF
jgi:hypothetical protein